MATIYDVTLREFIPNNLAHSVALFIGIWTVNGMGLIVDGSGETLHTMAICPTKYWEKTSRGWTTVDGLKSTKYTLWNDIQVGGKNSSHRL